MKEIAIVLEARREAAKLIAVCFDLVKSSQLNVPLILTDQVGGTSKQGTSYAFDAIYNEENVWNKVALSNNPYGEDHLSDHVLKILESE